MQNDISVSELLGRVRGDIERWEETLKSAQVELSSAQVKVDEASAEITRLQQMFEGLRRYIPYTEDQLQKGEFSDMSTREAVKLILERAHGQALSRSEISDRLIQGGIRTGSSSFQSNVSAVLSVMQSKYQEVVKTSTGWMLAQPLLVNSASNDEAA